MTQEDVIGVGKVDLQVPGIFEHRIGVSAGVEEESPTVNFDQCGESPLTNPGISEHGRKHGDAYRILMKKASKPTVIK